MTARDAVQTILTRNAFYRDGYRLLLRISIILGIVILILTAGLVGMILSTNVRQVYFATTADGRIIPIVPLDEPFIKQGDLIAWTADTIRRSLQIGYHDYRQRLQDVSVNFSARGWESFTKALKDSRRLEAIEARELVMDVEIEAAPEVVAQGLDGGVYKWVLQIPMTVKFQGDQAPSETRSLLKLTVVRRSTLEHPKGIGIEQWIEVPADQPRR